jgi:hypothetical protein
VSAERRARESTIAAHKARGTYIERRPRDMAIDTFISHARIPRDRESQFLEGAEWRDLTTNKRAKSAESHQSAPPAQHTPWRDGLGVTSESEAKKTTF